MFIVHAGVTYRPGIYAFHSIHTCSNSSNISSNWHDRRDTFEGLLLLHAKVFQVTVNISLKSIITVVNRKLKNRAIAY